jgi:hypothetical protein
MKDFPTFFGKVPVGTKGQIVIPAEARRELNSYLRLPAAQDNQYFTRRGIQ